MKKKSTQKKVKIPPIPYKLDAKIVGYLSEVLKQRRKVFENLAK